MIGMALASHGSDSVKWHEVDRSEAFPLKGISAVVLSWFLSPLMSGLIAALFFWTARTFILRHDDSYDRVFMFLPVLVFICTFINVFYVFDKGVSQQCASSLVPCI
jgi:solute carrier family 20 (sodium-dependent phosphate transporter)